jgi:hypothetical protein
MNAHGRQPVKNQNEGRRTDFYYGSFQAVKKIPIDIQERQITALNCAILNPIEGTLHQSIGFP